MLLIKNENQQSFKPLIYEILMVLVKVLGFVDILSAIAFLLLVFGMTPWLQFSLFCIGILFLKGLFVFSGDALSVVDIFSAVLLIISLFATLPSLLLWIPAFLLLAKGVVSFL
jgi:hypothetical protein